MRVKVAEKWEAEVASVESHLRVYYKFCRASAGVMGEKIDWEDVCVLASLRDRFAIFAVALGAVQIGGQDE
jgi:hypothetical protein